MAVCPCKEWGKVSDLQARKKVHQGKEQKRTSNCNYILNTPPFCCCDKTLWFQQAFWSFLPLRHYYSKIINDLSQIQKVGLVELPKCSFSPSQHETQSLKQGMVLPVRNSISQHREDGIWCGKVPLASACAWQHHKLSCMKRSQLCSSIWPKAPRLPTAVQGHGFSSDLGKRECLPQRWDDRAGKGPGLVPNRDAPGPDNPAWGWVMSQGCSTTLMLVEQDVAFPSGTVAERNLNFVPFPKAEFFV